jgi:hypothetical protein
MKKSKKKSKQSVKKSSGRSPKHYVYVIGLNPYLDGELSQWYWYPNDATQFIGCYVGVTKDPKKRWSDHAAQRKCREPSRVSKFIKENELTRDENFRIIFSGSKKKCYELEKHLRPYPNMYLNERVGGIPR